MCSNDFQNRNEQQCNHALMILSLRTGGEREAWSDGAGGTEGTEDGRSGDRLVGRK